MSGMLKQFFITEIRFIFHSIWQPLTFYQTKCLTAFEDVWNDKGRLYSEIDHMYAVFAEL